jgi:hypothetical protein
MTQTAKCVGVGVLILTNEKDSYVSLPNLMDLSHVDNAQWFKNRGQGALGNWWGDQP